MPIAAAKTMPPPARWARLGVHARVIAIAIVFGLGAYAVVQGMIAVTRHLGWLDWLHK
jgi:hypothetical protein